MKRVIDELTPFATHKYKHFEGEIIVFGRESLAVKNKKSQHLMLAFNDF